MWTAEHRRAADRRGLRYPSDMTEAEWQLIEVFVPPARHGGRKREANVRVVVNTIFYVLSTGCQWSPLPKDLPPKITARSIDRGALQRMHEALYVAAREAAPREAKPDGGDHRQSDRPLLSRRYSRPRARERRAGRTAVSFMR